MLGTADRQVDLLDAAHLCGHLIPEGSIHGSLAELGDRLFSDGEFEDLYDVSKGRPSVPPSLLAKVLLLQSLEGTSDRETVDRVRCDLRWKVALHLPLTDEGFHPTVLCYFRERLRRSGRPRRIFDRFKEVASEAGLLSRRGVRVLDSTPVLSAVQTQDTVSLIRGALRRLLRVLDPDAKVSVSKALSRDDYDQVGKPAIDWDDEDARAALVDELVRDAVAALAVIEGRDLAEEVKEAAELLATVAGQDVEQDESGRFRIRRGVTKGRVISVVDPEARHGRKSNHGPFDGYKAHVAVEPESELISEVDVAPANVADAEVAVGLLPELEDPEPQVTVVADSAYGGGPIRQSLTGAGAALVVKAPPEPDRGVFPLSAFAIDLDRGEATCPAGEVARARPQRSGEVGFSFSARACRACPLRARCTTSNRGRKLTVSPHHEVLAEARARQRTAQFREIYNSKRPTVERIISRLVRRGGRKARYRGTNRVLEQLTLKAAAENLLRMLRLGLTPLPDGEWTVV